MHPKTHARAHAHTQRSKTISVTIQFINKPLEEKFQPQAAEPLWRRTTRRQYPAGLITPADAQYTEARGENSDCQPGH